MGDAGGARTQTHTCWLASATWKGPNGLQLPPLFARCLACKLANFRLAYTAPFLQSACWDSSRGSPGACCLVFNVGGAALLHLLAERMLGRLKGLTDPEAKRKAIGAEFIDVFRWVFGLGCVLSPCVRGVKANKTTAVNKTTAQGDRLSASTCHSRLRSTGCLRLVRL